MSTAEHWGMMEPRLTKYIPHTPTVRQQVALLYDGDEMLYGGAAGGGKSDYLLMCALQYADLPGYAASLFRRTFPMLKQPGGLLPRAQEWLEGTDAVGAARADGYYTRYDFPAGGTLIFGHMQHEGDQENYQGGEYDFVGYDELVQFTRQMYTYLFSRIRHSHDSTIPGRMRAGSNPGGPGHDWVRSRWQIPDSFEDQFQVTTYVDEEGNDRERIFLPSHIDDNPHIDQRDYKRKLANLDDPVTRSRLLRGDWSVREGGDMFDESWWKYDYATPESPRRVRYWDLAATEQKDHTDPDWTVGVLMTKTGYGEDAHWWIEDIVRFRAEPAVVRKRVKQTAEQDKRTDQSNIAIVIEEEGGASGKDSIDRFKQELAGWSVRGFKPTGKKAVRSSAMATSASIGRVHLVVGDWNQPFVGETNVFPGGGHDDQVDAAAGAYNHLNRGMTWEELNDDVSDWEEGWEEIETSERMLN